jgi:hypothetical protein
MSLLAAALAISLSNGGYALSGGTVEIAVAWSVEQPLPPARLTWELSAGNAKLVHGELELAEDKPAKLSIELPEVRTRTALTWRYKLRDLTGGKLLTEGEESHLRHSIAADRGNSAAI